MYRMVYFFIFFLCDVPQLKTKNGKNFCENYLSTFSLFHGGGSTGTFSFPPETFPARGPRVQKIEIIGQH